jgi:hypothetical protein
MSMSPTEGDEIMAARERSTSRLVRSSALAAIVAGALLVVKVAYIFAIDGAENAAQSVLYLAGLALPLFAASGVAAHLARRTVSRIGAYLGIVLAHVMFVLMLSDGVKGLINAIADVPEYVATEIPVAVAGLAWIVVGYRLWTAATRHRIPEAAAAV